MDRRRFLQGAAASAVSWPAAGMAGAAGDPSRIALVIGNGRYGAAPLPNPGNDATAMADLLDQAGFSVERLLDAGRDEMATVIWRFAQTAQRGETRMALFYYAGHGAQLDWRNYLLPVDAQVRNSQELRERCVDLGLLLGQWAEVKDKTFIVILDACRNDPFGDGYRPEHKGLSQFDAPVGCLLAYATAPGNVAADGAGKNGLYTEHLVRELSRRGTRIEDALKRVRLGVRLASGGEQVPWETTSLESDVFIFNDAPRKLSESELEKLYEAEVAEWERIKGGREVAPYAAYLSQYPNGRFAEIAQMRINRLLAAAVRPPAAPQPAPGLVGVPPAPTSAAPAIDLVPGGALPHFLVPSANPYSAGTYPLGRHFTLGDVAEFSRTDSMTGVQEASWRLTITRVDEAADRVEANDGEHVYDLMGNELVSPMSGRRDVPGQFAPAELQLGKRWSAAWVQSVQERTLHIELDLRIVAFETIKTALGEFSAFRVEGSGWQIRRSWHGGPNMIQSLFRRYWITPGINYALRFEATNRASGRVTRSDRIDLTALRQQAVDAGTGSGRGGRQIRSLTG